MKALSERLEVSREDRVCYYCGGKINAGERHVGKVVSLVRDSLT